VQQGAAVDGRLQVLCAALLAQPCACAACVTVQLLGGDFCALQKAAARCLKNRCVHVMYVCTCNTGWRCCHGLLLTRSADPCRCCARLLPVLCHWLAAVHAHVQDVQRLQRESHHVLTLNNRGWQKPVVSCLDSTTLLCAGGHTWCASLLFPSCALAAQVSEGWSCIHFAASEATLGAVS
jgi:hypothetical protein